MYIFARGPCRSFQFTKLLEKTSEDSEAYNVVKRKVQHCKGKYLKVCHVYNARILRSRKHLMERVLPRRSMRVVPKVRISLTAYGSILLLG